MNSSQIIKWNLENVGRYAMGARVCTQTFTQKYGVIIMVPQLTLAWYAKTVHELITKHFSINVNKIHTES